MTELDHKRLQQAEEVRRMIAQIEERKSLYFIAKLMHHNHNQIKRMKETGRCQHWQFQMLQEIHKDVVPHETEQNVMNKMPLCDRVFTEANA